MTNERKQSFFTEVLNQIKSKDAKKFVSDELRHHLEESKRILREKGFSEEEAEEKAIKQMGNPTKIGIQMNKLHRPKVDWWLLILLVPAFLLGFLPLIPLGYSGIQHFLLSKTVTVLLGIFIIIGLMFMDYRKWKEKGWIFYLIGILPLLAIQFLSNRMINGVPSLRVGVLTIEPSMSIPFFFLAWAFFFSSSKLKVWQFVPMFIVPLLMFLSVPSVGIGYLYSIMVFIMLWWSKFSRKTIITFWTIAASSLVFLIIGSFTFLKVYQKERLLAFIHPESYQNGAGYLILKLREFIVNAGWFGNPKGQEFIPEAHTNFVYVTFTYYYGWLFAAVLAIILALFVARSIFITYQVKDPYGKLLIVGAVAVYTTQFMTNVSMSLGFFPLLGMPLPFMSYGLMPTVLNAGLIGVVLSVYRRKDLIRYSV